MTISTRILLGISAAALSLSLALAPAALAQDPMAQDTDFRNSLSRDGGIKKDTIPTDPTAKRRGDQMKRATSALDTFRA